MERNKNRGLKFEERNTKQHKSRMARLLTIIRKGYDCKERDYEDISSYCREITDLSNSGEKFQKRVLKAFRVLNTSEEIPTDWIECIKLIEQVQ